MITKVRDEQGVIWDVEYPKDIILHLSTLVRIGKDGRPIWAGTSARVSEIGKGKRYEIIEENDK